MTQHTEIHSISTTWQSNYLEHIAVAINYMNFNQGLEGYSRDPGFGQNTVRDSGKRKTS